METIKVRVVKRKGRKNLFLRYIDPATGKQVCKSAGTSNARDALKEAGKWQAEVQEGRYQRSSKMLWMDFRSFYETSTAKSQKPSTVLNYQSTFNAFEAACNPQRVSDLNTAKVTAFATDLGSVKVRQEKRERIEYINGRRRRIVEFVPVEYTLSVASIARHLRHLKAIARWAHGQELIPKVPKFDIPGKAAGAFRSKGRAVTLEEFERMLAKVPEVVGEGAAESWQFLLRGLWATGLRLGEALALRWDHLAGGCSVSLEGKHSVLVFDGASQKSGKTEMVPLAPEAVELFEPWQRDTGYVFNPRRGEGQAARSTFHIGRTIAAIGASAGVVVDPERGKTATAHDLRRSFGTRWAKRVMPAVLKQIMRHSSIETTMTYYAAEAARVTAAELWKAVGDQSGDQRAEKAGRAQKTP